MAAWMPPLSGHAVLGDRLHGAVAKWLIEVVQASLGIGWMIVFSPPNHIARILQRRFVQAAEFIQIISGKKKDTTRNTR